MSKIKKKGLQREGETYIEDETLVDRLPSKAASEVNGPNEHHDERHHREPVTDHGERKSFHRRHHLSLSLSLLWKSKQFWNPLGVGLLVRSFFLWV